LKVLFIVPYAPTRVRTRPFHLIRALAGEGHRVSLATVCENDAEFEAVQQLSPDLDVVVAERIHRTRSLWNCLTALPGRRPLQASYSWSPSLARRIVQLAEETKFDVVHVEHLRGARYGLLMKEAAARNGNKPAVVWDSVDCISSLFHQSARESTATRSRMAARLELPRTERFEGWLTTYFDRVLVTSKNDGAELAKLADRWHPRQNGSGESSTSRIRVIPNGVDLGYFSPAEGPRDPQTLVISGKMSYHANVTAVVRFVQDVMPKIWSELPGVRLLIVGKDPPGEVRRLGVAWDNGQSPVPEMNGSHETRVQITGTVEDIRPFLRRATVAVAPILYGAGIQNKVLEALACGLPVVATPGAVSALGARPGHDLLVARDAGELAAATLSLLRNPELRARLGDAGRALVEQQHQWRSVARDLGGVYREATGVRSEAKV
jgi:glycosyltransferase involved in cell wall biosynthesis